MKQLGQGLIFLSVVCCCMTYWVSLEFDPRASINKMGAGIILPIVILLCGIGSIKLADVIREQQEKKERDQRFQEEERIIKQWINEDATKTVSSVFDPPDKKGAFLNMIDSAKRGDISALKGLVFFMQKFDHTAIDLAGEALVEIFFSKRATREQKEFLWENRDVTIKIIESIYEDWEDLDPSDPSAGRQKVNRTEREFVTLYDRIRPSVDKK
jgi:hypothetical protein